MRSIILVLPEDATATTCGSCRQLYDAGSLRPAHCMTCRAFGWTGYDTGNGYPRHPKCIEAEETAKSAKGGEHG